MARQARRPQLAMRSLCHRRCTTVDGGSLHGMPGEVPDLPQKPCQQAITIIGGSDGTAPAQLRAYVNREGLDFSTVADLTPMQQWDLQENLSGQMEYPTQYAGPPGCHACTAQCPLAGHAVPAARMAGSPLRLEICLYTEWWLAH